MVTYSKLAFSDLAYIKEKLQKEDSILAMVTINQLVDSLWNIENEKWEEASRVFNITSQDYFIRMLDYLVFFRQKDKDIFIDRIIENNIECIKLLES